MKRLMVIILMAACVPAFADTGLAVADAMAHAVEDNEDYRAPRWFWLGAAVTWLVPLIGSAGVIVLAYQDDYLPVPNVRITYAQDHHGSDADV